jgi:hypothetical protein
MADRALLALIPQAQRQLLVNALTSIAMTPPG